VAVAYIQLERIWHRALALLLTCVTLTASAGLVCLVAVLWSAAAVAELLTLLPSVLGVGLSLHLDPVVALVAGALALALALALLWPAAMGAATC